jgi:hypothetical protein
MKHALWYVATGVGLGLVVTGVLAGCGGQAQEETPEGTSSYLIVGQPQNPPDVISFWGYSVDGRQVPCVKAEVHSSSSVAVSLDCDWSLALADGTER